MGGAALIRLTTVGTSSQESARQLARQLKAEESLWLRLRLKLVSRPLYAGTQEPTRKQDHLDYLCVPRGV